MSKAVPLLSTDTHLATPHILADLGKCLRLHTGRYRAEPINYNS
jgi:hypothetical protein